MPKVAKSQRGDIELPNESGRVDPRLKRKESVSDSLRRAGEGLKAITERFAPPTKRGQGFAELKRQ